MNPRAFCYRCHKAARVCVCSQVPRVDNRTPVYVLQHPKERGHPLGTARFIGLGLARARIEVAGSRSFAGLHHPMELPEGAALLYPGPGSRDLAQLQPDERPRALVALDGTWSTAARLYKENRDWLDRLPQVRLDPAHPSNYRIRREPRAECLSTLESVLDALALIDGQSGELLALRRAFDSMIDDQLRHIGTGPKRSVLRVRQREERSVPAVLRRAPQRVVVVAVEMVRRSRADGRRTPVLARLCATRLHSGGCFDAMALAPEVLGPTLCRHMELGGGELTLEGAAVRDAFHRFLQPGDVIAGWNQAALDLVAPLMPASAEPAISIKGSYGNLHRSAPGSMDAILSSHDWPVPEVVCSGRAGQRLAQAVAIARGLSAAS